MKSFIGLWIKEWHMMRNFFILTYVCTLGYIALVIWNSPNYVTAESVAALLIFGVIIIPATVLFSLNTEANQMEMFLHTTNSIHQQLIVKILHGIVNTCIFYLLLGISITLVYVIESIVTISFTSLFQHLFVYSVIAVIISFFPTTIILLLWSLHQWFKQYIGWGVSVVILFILFYIASLLLGFLKELAIYTTWTNWWKISIHFYDSLAEPLLFGSRTDSGYMEVSVGFFTFYGTLCIIFYFLSVWITNRKVEV